MILAAIGARRRGSDPAPLTVRRMIVGQVVRQSDNIGRTTDLTFTSKHAVYAEADELVVTYSGAWLPAGVTLPMRAGLHHDGTTYPLTFSGVRDVTLTSGGRPQSDPLTLNARVMPGDVIEVRTNYRGRSDSGQYAGGRGHWYDSPILDGDHTTDAGAWPVLSKATQYNGYNGYRPVMPLHVTGMTPAGTLAILGVGDSILESGTVTKNGTPGDLSGTFFPKALEAAAIAHGNFGQWASTYAVRTGSHIPADVDSYTHALVEWSYNDLNQAHATSAALSTVQAAAIATWQGYASAGLVVAQTVTTPNSTGTWTTIEGQTPVASSAGYRVPFRAWLRDGAPILSGVAAATGTTDPAALRVGNEGHPLSVVLDLDATVNAGADVFRVDSGALTADGGHPNDTGHALMAAPVQAWATNLIA